MQLNHPCDAEAVLCDSASDYSDNYFDLTEDTPPPSESEFEYEHEYESESESESDDFDYFASNNSNNNLHPCILCITGRARKGRSDMFQCTTYYGEGEACHCHVFAHRTCIEATGVTAATWVCGHCANLETPIDAGSNYETPARNSSAWLTKRSMYQWIAYHGKKNDTKAVLLLDGKQLSAHAAISSKAPGLEFLIPNASVADSAEMVRRKETLKGVKRSRCRIFPGQRVGHFLRQHATENLRASVMWLDYCATAICSTHSAIEDVRAAVEAMPKDKPGYLYATLCNRNAGDFPPRAVVQYLLQVIPLWTGRGLAVIPDRHQHKKDALKRLKVTDPKEWNARHDTESSVMFVSWENYERNMVAVSFYVYV
jgi:hypothetical protein